MTRSRLRSKLTVSNPPARRLQAAVRQYKDDVDTGILEGLKFIYETETDHQRRTRVRQAALRQHQAAMAELIAKENTARAKLEELLAQQNIARAALADIEKSKTAALQEEAAAKERRRQALCEASSGSGTAQQGVMIAEGSSNTALDARGALLEGREEGQDVEMAEG